MTTNIGTRTISPASIPYWGMLRNLNDDVKRELVVLLVNSIGVTPEADKTDAEEEQRKKKLMSLAGCWSDVPDGDDYYEMMRNRNLGNPANREVRSFDD